MTWPTRGTVTDTTPRWVWRFDDGRASCAKEGKICVDYGISPTLFVNADTVGTGSRVSWDEIRDLIDYGESKGVNVLIASHSNNNWALGGIATEAQIDAYYGWKQILEELDPTKIINECGYEHWAKTYGQIGDAIQNAWCTRHRAVIINALEELGYEYAYGLAESSGRGSDVAFRDNADANDLNTAMANPSEYDFAEGMAMGGPIFATAGNIGVTKYVEDGYKMASSALYPKVRWYAYRPGLTESPFEFPNPSGVDQGGSVVVRGAYNSDDGVWENDPRSGASPFVLGVGNNGDVINDWHMTFQSKIYKALANGNSGIVAMHSEEDTNSDAVTTYNFAGGSQAATAMTTDPFSVKHAAWFMRKLHDLGFIKLVDHNEYNEYLYSDYADGVDLVGNPDMRVPSVEMAKAYETSRGERSDVEGDPLVIHDYDNDETRRVDPDHFVAAGTGISLITNVWSPDNTSNIEDLTQVAGEPWSQDLEGGIYGALWMGRDAESTTPLGDNGIIMHPNDNAQPFKAHLALQSIPPGRYRLQLDLANSAPANMTFTNMQVVGLRAYHANMAKYEGITGIDDPSVVRQRQLMHRVGWHGFSLLRTTQWTHEMDLELPSAGPASLIGETSWNPPALTNTFGDTQSTTITVPGARPGAKVLVGWDCDQGSDNYGRNVAFTGHVDSNDSVTVTVTNMRDEAIDIPATVVTVYVEDLNWESQIGDGQTYSPWGPWYWSVGMSFRFGSSVELQLKNFKLTKLPDRF